MSHEDWQTVNETFGYENSFYLGSPPPPPQKKTVPSAPPIYASSGTLHNGSEGYWGNGEAKQLENKSLPSPLPLLNLVNVSPGQGWPDTRVVYHLAGESGWPLILIKYQLSSGILERKYMRHKELHWRYRKGQGDFCKHFACFARDQCPALVKKGQDR